MRHVCERSLRVLVRARSDDGRYLGDSWAMGTRQFQWAQPCLMSVRVSIPENI